MLDEVHFSLGAPPLLDEERRILIQKKAVKKYCNVILIKQEIWSSRTPVYLIEQNYTGA